MNNGFSWFLRVNQNINLVTQTLVSLSCYVFSIRFYHGVFDDDNLKTLKYTQICFCLNLFIPKFIFILYCLWNWRKCVSLKWSIIFVYIGELQFVFKCRWHHITSDWTYIVHCHTGKAGRWAPLYFSSYFLCFQLRKCLH